MKSKSLNKKR